VTTLRGRRRIVAGRGAAVILVISLLGLTAIGVSSSGGFWPANTAQIAVTFAVPALIMAIFWRAARARLRAREASVQELADALGASQQNVSKHLAVLHEAGIVARRKAGTYTYYAIADDGVLALCEEVCGGLRRQFSELAELVGGTLG